MNGRAELQHADVARLRLGLQQELDTLFASYARDHGQNAAFRLGVNRLVPGRDLTQIALYSHAFDTEKPSTAVTNITSLVPQPSAPFIKTNQPRLELNKNRGLVLRFDFPGGRQPVAKPVEVRAFGRQIKSLSTSITVSTSSSLRCGYIGNEKIRCAFRSATGNCPSRYPRSAVPRMVWIGQR